MGLSIYKIFVSLLNVQWSWREETWELTRFLNSGNVKICMHTHTHTHTNTHTDIVCILTTDPSPIWATLIRSLNYSGHYQEIRIIITSLCFSANISFIHCSSRINFSASLVLIINDWLHIYTSHLQFQVEAIFQSHHQSSRFLRENNLSFKTCSDIHLLFMHHWEDSNILSIKIPEIYYHGYWWELTSHKKVEILSLVKTRMLYIYLFKI